jgi:DNA repair protein RecO (recombination protein O)
MEWCEEAVVVGTRRHAEADVILEVMTRGRGRHLGLVRGGRSRRLRPVVQPGNTLEVTWRARLDEHLGSFRVEPIHERAAVLMTSGHGMFGIQLIAAHLPILPERDPHPRLYDALALIVDHLGEPIMAAEMMARFELLLLDELGFGLDLGTCAATGALDDLVYVSPKSGRAVSAAAGQPYRDRLLALPPFLSRTSGRPDAGSLDSAFRLTGHFLLRHVFEPRGQGMPDTREGFWRACRAAMPEAA